MGTPPSLCTYTEALHQSSDVNMYFAVSKTTSHYKAPHTMNPQLLKAVSNGDADLLAQIILSASTTAEGSSRCACLQGVTKGGSSALHIAARRGYLKLVEMICDRDVSLIMARNNLLDTPLICAARAGHVDVVDYLIKLASTQPDDTEYVLRACYSGGATAVHEAVRNGHASILRKLIRLKDAKLAEVNDGQGVSPLYMAVVSNRSDMVHILISGSRGGSLVKLPASHTGPDGRTALHAAVFARNAEEMCKSLQSWKPELAEEADSSGRTALHYAASSGKTGVVKLLLSKNSLLAYIPDNDGLYPLHYAAIAGNSEIIREIMETCPSCDELVDKKNRSILHCAVEFGRVKVVWYICRNPMFVSIMNAGDGEGNTPLHLAVKHGRVLSFVLLMMDIRVNLGIVNLKGLTPLDIAWNENTHKYSFSAFMNVYMGMSLLLCEAYSFPSNLATNLIYNSEDNKESSRYSDVSQSLLGLSVLIAAGSFAAAFTPPGDYITKGEIVGFTLFGRESPFLNYIGSNSMSFYLSAIATCLLIHASLATTPIRRRHYYLQLSTIMVLGAVVSMFTSFTAVVQLALDPQKSWRECLLFYFTLLVQQVTFFCMFWSWSLSAIPVCLRVLRRSKHPWQDMPLKVLAALASIHITSMVFRFITVVISAVKSIQLGKQDSYSWPGCHDAAFLHPT